MIVHRAGDGKPLGGLTSQRCTAFVDDKGPNRESDL